MQYFFGFVSLIKERNVVFYLCNLWFQLVQLVQVG